MKLSRRDLLKISGGAAVALAACGNESVAELPADPEVGANVAPVAAEERFKGGANILALDESPDFPLGVASGDVDSKSAVLWTKYIGAGQVSVHVWEDTTRASIIWRNNRAELREGFAHDAPNNLKPGKRYAFAYVADDMRSPIGHFRAAIAEDSLEVVTFAGFACTHYRREPFPALAHAAQRDDLDFWVCGGDKVYRDQLDGLQQNYRAAYERIWRQDGIAKLHQKASTYGTWDDHEFENNFNPEKTDPAVTALAKHSFFEHHPFKRPANDRVWRSVRWGQTLELFILDCRSERRPSKDIYISQEQMDWLKQGLADSPCVFKMIVNSVPIGDFPLVFDVKGYDRWTGYKHQRNEILDHINETGISDVWWLSGDFHFGSVGKVEKDGPSSAQREILWGPGGNRANPLYFMLDEPQWDFSTGDSNYVTLRCDPVARQVQVSVVSDRGDLLFDKTY